VVVSPGFANNPHSIPLSLLLYQQQLVTVVVVVVSLQRQSFVVHSQLNKEPVAAGTQSFLFLFKGLIKSFPKQAGTSSS